MPLGSQDLGGGGNWAGQVPQQRQDQRQEQRDSLSEPSRGDNYRVGRASVLHQRRLLPRTTRRGLSR